MPEWLLLVVGLLVAGVVVLLPLRQRAEGADLDDGELAAAELRHRVALETMRDLAADRRAGLIDEASHAVQMAEAEERAAQTLAALHAVALAQTASSEPAPGPAHGHGRRAAVLAAAVIGAVVVAGAFVPATGVANQTVTNRALADAQAAEAGRQARIGQLLDALGADPTDPRTLSDLADAYLAGSSQDDLVRAAVALRVLIEVEPERADAYERIMTAYLRAGDHENARAAHDAYAVLTTAHPVEVAFFDGLIALRGEHDPGRALAAFDRFLELAPDDPRAPMIRGLRDEAVGGS